MVSNGLLAETRRRSEVMLHKLFYFQYFHPMAPSWIPPSAWSPDHSRSKMVAGGSNFRALLQAEPHSLMHLMTYRKSLSA